MFKLCLRQEGVRVHSTIQLNMSVCHNAAANWKYRLYRLLPWTRKTFRWLLGSHLNCWAVPWKLITIFF